MNVYAILQSADINDEELLTAFIGAEGLMNSRPLMYQTSNPNDEELRITTYSVRLVGCLQPSQLMKQYSVLENTGD